MNFSSIAAALPSLLYCASCTEFLGTINCGLFYVVLTAGLNKLFLVHMPIVIKGISCCS